MGEYQRLADSRRVKVTFLLVNNQRIETTIPADENACSLKNMLFSNLLGEGKVVKFIHKGKIVPDNRSLSDFSML